MKYKFSFYVLVASVLISCGSAGKKVIGDGHDIYKIKKIEKINKWAVLYAEKGDSIYKIVTENDLFNSQMGCERIKRGASYKLNLVSMRDNPPLVDGKKLEPINFLDVPCRKFDNETTICIEPDNGIFDLYLARELAGLCYKK